MKNNHQTGYSLIELMIAVTLGLALLSFIIAIFQTVRSSSNYSNNLMTVQEIGRSVFHLLQKDLENATEVLNPKLIPAGIQQQLSKNSAVLFFKKNTQKIVYYVTETKRKDNKGTKILELDRRDLSISQHNQTALLDGVYDFKIFYGKKINNNLVFVPVQQVMHWQDIKLVEISFIAKSNMLERPFKFVLRVGKNYAL